MQRLKRFEPPRARVDDLIDGEALSVSRPREIDRAFWLIIGSAALVVPSYVARGLPGSVYQDLMVLACMIGFAFLIRAGRNWARILFLVLFALETLGALSVSAWLAQIGPAYVVVRCLQAAFEGYATWLTFRPQGSSWFHRSHKIGA